MFGIGYGPSSGETGATNALTGESGFAGTTGEGLVGNSSAFLNALMSGNQADISKLLAPQIGAISSQANQKTQTNAEFGSRSGGTNASNQNTMDTARGNVNDMVSGLTSGAIGTGLSTGAGLLSSSMGGFSAAFNQQQQMQNQRANQWNDIFNSVAGIAGGVAGGFGGGFGGGGGAGGMNPFSMMQGQNSIDPTTSSVSTLLG